MRKIIKNLAVVSILFAASHAHADNITPSQAREAAAYYLNCNTQYTSLKAKELTLVHQIDNPELGVPAAYFFTAPNGGWIILGGSTLIDPVIGFSGNGYLDMATLPANMQWWVNGYVDMVKEAQSLDTKGDYPDSEEWSDIANGKLPMTKEDIILLQDYWGQGSTTNPTYNYYCPVINNRTSVAGCVAIALGQICKYYRFPVQPNARTRVFIFNGQDLSIRYDTISYDYSLMPAHISSSTSRERILEVAKLCYTIGVGVKMNYHPDGSGANSETAMNFMSSYFKYQGGTIIRRNGDTDTSFVNTIRRQLENKDIVYMDGASDGEGPDAAGHAWVCAGYRTTSNKAFYMNWGWDGTGNGFFNLGDNNMPIRGMDYNFKKNQRAIIGMIPPEDSNRYGIVQVDNTVLGSAYPNPAIHAVTVPYSLDAAATLTVYGMDGRVVESRQVQAGSGEAVIRVNNLPAGIYIYRINSQTGKFVVR